MTAVARQHELDPKMVLRWAKELSRPDLEQLDGSALKQSAFIPTASGLRCPGEGTREAEEAVCRAGAGARNPS